MPAEYIILNASPALTALEELCNRMKPAIVDPYQLTHVVTQTIWYSFGHDDIESIYSTIEETVTACGLVEMEEMTDESLQYESDIIAAAFEAAVDLRQQVLQLGLYAPKEDYLVFPYDYHHHNKNDIVLKYWSQDSHVNAEPDGEYPERVNVTSAKGPHRATLRSTLSRYRAA